MTYIARDYTHDNIGKFLEIVERCCDHRPWFSDHLWENAALRRTEVIKYLADAAGGGKLWEVYHADAQGIVLTGIMLLNRVNFKIDAYCHFLFFDHNLRGKQRLCLDAMRWSFEHFELEALRIEVPTYASALNLWARRKLGFRYEAEATLEWWPKKKTRRLLEAASSKRKATFHKGQWHDVVMLSITRDEFSEWTKHLARRGLDSTDTGADGGNDSAPTGLPTEPPANPSTVSSIHTASATN